MVSASGEAARIGRLYRLLAAGFGPQHWWPCASGRRWEIVTGAILTQNCAWRNVEAALKNLTALDAMSAEVVLELPDSVLEAAIRPAGFFRQKCDYLKAMADFYLANEIDCQQSADLPMLRRRLLAVKGVGCETADSILLYAFNRPYFVIDAYTRRVAERHLKLDGQLPYDILQRHFMAALPPDVALYQEYHALIVAMCKNSCTKRGCGEFCQTLELHS